MKRRKGLEDFLPDDNKAERVVTIQAKIPESLKRELDRCLKIHRVTKKELIVAAIKAYISNNSK